MFKIGAVVSSERLGAPEQGPEQAMFNERCLSHQHSTENPLRQAVSFEVGVDKVFDSSCRKNGN